MRSRTPLILGVAMSCALLVSTATAEERTHAPKGIWIGMMANLSEVQGIVSAVMVHDMKRAADLATQLTNRQRYVAGLDSVKGEWKKSYERLATLAGELQEAAAFGDDKETLAKLTDVLVECNACHYDLRDRKRRAAKTGG